MTLINFKAWNLQIFGIKAAYETFSNTPVMHTDAIPDMHLEKNYMYKKCEPILENEQ